MSDSPGAHSVPRLDGGDHAAGRTSRASRWRILFLPAAALVIFAACWYKTTRDYPLQPVARGGAILMPAPIITLPNSESPPEIIRLERYLGRHAVLLVFFDAAEGLSRDPRIGQCLQSLTEIEASGAVVLAVSTALPQENRLAITTRQQTDPAWNIPFPVLTDLPPDLAAHRLWGALSSGGSPQPGVYVIDRAGRVQWRDGKPLPQAEMAWAIAAVIEGTAAVQDSPATSSGN